MSDNPIFLYAAEYESVDDAKADLKELKGSSGRSRSRLGAKREMKKEVRAQAEKIEKAIDKA